MELNNMKLTPEIIGYINARGWDKNNLSQEQLEVIRNACKVEEVKISQVNANRQTYYIPPTINDEEAIARKKKLQEDNDEFWGKRIRDDNNAYCAG